MVQLGTQVALPDHNERLRSGNDVRTAVIPGQKSFPMRRSLVMSVFAASAALFAPQAAQAQVILNTGVNPVCGGNAFTSCFSAKIEIIASSSNSTTFDVWVKNMSAGSIFTQIGVGGLNPSNPYTFTSISGSATSGNFGAPVIVEDGPNGLNGAGIDTPIFGLDAAGNDGLLYNGVAMFRFSVNKAPGSLDLSTVQLAIHDQGRPYLTGECGGSNKAVYERLNGNTTSGSFVATSTCGDGSLIITSTPEPSTYALMGAGLLAVGVTARRRRNNA